MSDQSRVAGLVDAVCAFWFSDNEQARSPFPAELREALRPAAEAEYGRFLESFTDRDWAEVSDDELVSVFENLLFAAALELIDPEDTDLALTMHHPFMPRIGDRVDDAERGPSDVVRRWVEPDETPEKTLHFAIELEVCGTGERWESRFALPT